MEKLELSSLQTGGNSSEANFSKKRALSSISESPFKSPGEPAPKKAALDRTASTGEDGLSAKKQKELIETEERLKMQ